MPEPLKSGRPWYWLHLDDRPEGVYVAGTNLTAERIADLAGRGHDAGEIRMKHPTIGRREVRACCEWKTDQIEAAKRGETQSRC